MLKMMKNPESVPARQLPTRHAARPESANISRRAFLETTAAAGLLAALPSAGFAASPDPEDLLQWVDPRIGTGGHGHCFPGATLPFGAVQLSPTPSTTAGTGAPATTSPTPPSWASATPT